MLESGLGEQSIRALKQSRRGCSFFWQFSEKWLLSLDTMIPQLQVCVMQINGKWIVGG